MTATSDTTALIREMAETLPFNVHLGVRLSDVSPGRAEAVLPENGALDNHIGTVHAVAEIAPAEAAAAVAAAAGLPDVVAKGFVPIVRSLEVRYRAPARGDLTATAAVADATLAGVREQIEADGRAALDVDVDVTDPAGTVVAEVRVDLVLRRQE